MKQNIDNIFVIAQKEFADNLWSPRFRVLLLMFTLVIFSFSVQSVKNGFNIFDMGFIDVAQIIGLFLPLAGIGLGFDAVIKERKSASLNVLLAHPVFRDNIITGKIAGGLATLALVVFISVIASVGTMIALSGVQVGLAELSRVLIFTGITFIYLSTFLALGVLISIFSSSSTNSFIYGLVVWINLIMVFGAIISVASSIATGESILDSGSNRDVRALNGDLQKISPIHHYSEAVVGVPGISVGGVNVMTGQKITSGIFDFKHTMGDWFNDYWTNLVALTVMPVLLFIAAFVAFLRKDITW
ncbi:ABC-type transport system involved in multi-copper enzyme maturation, permease component [Candidatus Methanoperedens nitroreducens]|uniref:ABC-type transport system involved in multi-copper enzyme maturation, permease component n=1 Tax=Candidatus Methanoperedens nitratireducens TaxID=1392998 RepID=A0A062UVI3_9EURY|nr:ABC transporter permease [Candidatus Methanoperedens nitroreducens]KCZ71026.1 ABC-type transport system involved in multi-copper enzyme maturation, permease component [Candidatus Methanoperedens nitroreducens]MDJ1421601.1 ABC transporter permease [Candidatus Methanoperedens sp.]